MQLLVTCDVCSISFLKEKKQVNESIKQGWKTFCSTECLSQFRHTGKELACKNCGKLTHKVPSEITRSKTGDVYCSRSCATVVNNSYKTLEARGLPPPINSYREKALEAYGNVCNRCGYKEYPVCKVHHTDRNRKNNKLDNLEVLCPTCHDVEHYLKNDGPWKSVKRTTFGL